jgi:hypothetical protein
LFILNTNRRLPSINKAEFDADLTVYSERNPLGIEDLVEVFARIQCPGEMASIEVVGKIEDAILTKRVRLQKSIP